MTTTAKVVNSSHRRLNTTARMSREVGIERRSIRINSNPSDARPSTSDIVLSSMRQRL